MPDWNAEISPRLRSLKLAPIREAEICEELSQHLDDRFEEFLASGTTQEEARRAVLAELDEENLLAHSLSAVEKEAPQNPVVAGGGGSANFFASIWQDLRFGLRMLRKSPGFTAIAILTLALGIGANTAIFSYVDAWIIKPLPYSNPEQLIVFSAHDTKKGWTSENVTSTADFFDFQKQNTSFQQVAGWSTWNFNLTGDGPPEFVEGGRVGRNFFDTLGVKPILGRTFTPDDDRSGAARVVVIGQGLWRTRFAGDPHIIGRNIKIDDQPSTVFGVMPANFQFPLMGIANLWTPFALTDQERADRNGSWFSSFGRLKPDVTKDQAAANATEIFAALEKQYPLTNKNITFLVSTMTEKIGEHEGTTQVMACLCIVGLILLIACANVANLMLARATARAKEFAVRRALGAPRIRLARQLVSESLLLFFFGAIAGTAFGAWGMRWIQSAIPDHVRGYLVNFGQVNLDLTTLGFTLGIALLCGLIFGLAPAFESSRLELSQPLKESSGKASSTRRTGRLRRIFVCAEIALAVVVLICTTLLVRSFVISVLSSPGFDATNISVAQLSLPKTRYTQPANLRNFADDVLARLKSLPQATSVAAASGVPFGGFGRGVEIQALDKPAPLPGEGIGARFTAVTPDYFSTMKIHLLSGRTFTSADAPEALLTAVVNKTLATRLWPNEDPIGKKLSYGDKHIACTIVGVVDDIKMFYLRAQPERQMYVPYAQAPSNTLGFVVRTADNAVVATSIRDQIWAVDSNQPISSVEKLATLIEISDAGNRVLTKLMVFFGALATLLGAIGIYGLMSHMVGQRTQEIGIRIALGARPLAVLRMLLSNGLKLALLGIAIGAAVAFAVTRFLATLLYGVTPNDAATFSGVALLFLLVAILANYVPARRATRVDPIVALRYE